MYPSHQTLFSQVKQKFGKNKKLNDTNTKENFGDFFYTPREDKLASAWHN